MLQLNRTSRFFLFLISVVAGLLYLWRERGPVVVNIKLPPAFNPVNQSSAVHDSVFKLFPRWTGEVQPNVVTNFLGVRTAREFICGSPGNRSAYYNLYPSRRIECDELERIWASPRGTVFEAGLPCIDEEYSEWVHVLQAVRDADENIGMTFVELGAGFGFWSMNVIFAARLLKPKMRVRVIAVEAMASHFEWMLQHFVSNGIDPGNGQHLLLYAAVGTRPGITYMPSAKPQNYGVSVGPATRDSHPIQVFTLAALLATENLIDMLDMDVQGAEKTIFSAEHGDVALQVLNRKVKRVQIGTHGEQDEERLSAFFRSHKWRVESAIPFTAQKQLVHTPHGVILPWDGEVYAINTRLE